MRTHARGVMISNSFVKYTRTALLALASISPWLAGCAGGPGEPAASTGTLWGQVRLVRNEGVTAANTEEPFYQDRALRDVQFVDYSRPGFAVLYLEDGSGGGEPAVLRIDGSRFGAKLRPRTAAVGPAGIVSIENADTSSHTVSCAQAQLLRTLAPGEQVTIQPSSPGPYEIFLLDAAGEETLVVVAPGSFAVTSERGSWELANLAPGPAVLHLWHPRFPAISRTLEVEADTISKVEIEIGVQHLNPVTPLAGTTP